MERFDKNIDKSWNRINSFWIKEQSENLSENSFNQKYMKILSAFVEWDIDWIEWQIETNNKIIEYFINKAKYEKERIEKGIVRIKPTRQNLFSQIKKYKFEDIDENKWKLWKVWKYCYVAILDDDIFVEKLWYMEAVMFRTAGIPFMATKKSNAENEKKLKESVYHEFSHLLRDRIHTVWIIPNNEENEVYKAALHQYKDEIFAKYFWVLGNNSKKLNKGYIDKWYVINWIFRKKDQETINDKIQKIYNISQHLSNRIKYWKVPWEMNELICIYLYSKTFDEIYKKMESLYNRKKNYLKK